MWVIDCHRRIAGKYRLEDLNNIEPSVTAVEIDDFITLYSVKDYLLDSANYRSRCVRKRVSFSA